MSLNGFSYCNVGRISVDKIPVVLYHFKDSFNKTYIVELFEYKHSVYAIKFYQKNHANSKHRYNLVNRISSLKRKKTTGAQNFFSILNTVVNICSETITKNKIASFGFLGAPRVSEMDTKKNAKNINSDNTIANTQRFSIYKSYILRYFNPADFEFIESPSASILLARNNKNRESLSKETAESYIISDIIPSL